MLPESKIYKGQDYELSLDTKEDLATAASKKILFKKPDGTKGEWVPTVVGTALVYSVTGTVNDAAGQWSYQAYYEVGGKKYFSEIATKTILNNIK